MNNTFIITFEINNAIRRANFKKGIKSNFQFYCPIHRNAWAVHSSLPAKEIRNTLNRYMIAGDRIFVIRSGTQAAWKNAYSLKNSEWLKKYL